MRPPPGSHRARSFKIECVEVKSRKEARLPQALADMIVNQLQDTRRVLETRFFAADPPRIDGELQRARLTSLLHYYADRSADHGLIPAGRMTEIHRYIDRVEETGEPAEISMRGYVISLDGDEGFKKRYGDVPLTVLTAGDLGRVGFTTRVDADPTGLHLLVKPRHRLAIRVPTAAEAGNQRGGRDTSQCPPTSRQATPRCPNIQPAANHGLRNLGYLLGSPAARLGTG